MRYVLAMALIGALLICFDIWCTHTRSLIPLSISETVVDMELREEKHHGIDDVCLIRTSDSNNKASLRHIDSSIYENLEIGDQIKKEAGETSLMVNDRAITLEFSQDAKGMVQAQLVAGSIIALLLILSARNKAAHNDRVGRGGVESV